MFFREIYEIFRTAFTKITLEWRLLQLVNVSTKIYFSKSVSIDFSHLCFDIQWRVSEGLTEAATGYVLRNFVKFMGKHMFMTLFFNKVADLWPGTLLKMRLWHRCFSVNFAKFLRTTLCGCFLNKAYYYILNF